MSLAVSLQEAERRISKQIEEGNALLLNTWLAPRNHEYQIWEDCTISILKLSFSSDEQADKFLMRGRLSYPNRSEQIKAQISTLNAIHKTLYLFEPNVSNYHAESTAGGSVNLSKEIFIVHGHDDGAKQSVARFIEKLGLKATILHEAPDRGRTIIEKFEDHSDVGFAVVLLTADDQGGVAGSDVNQLRARQNVILELGFFIGKLGRSRVCAVKADRVESPSDLHGVLYTHLDSGGAWKLSLAKEMRAAGIEIDMNLVL